jgi:TM2 domain-containing membrane protein YozV
VKSKTTALILAILLPGIDRIYLGKVGTGILKIITGGGLGIWWIIDIISIASGKATDKAGNKLQ